MTLSNPAGLAGLALIIPLVAWYLLRARRPRSLVSSTFLWQQVPQAQTAATPWQRFRGDATFWLSLLTIIAGSLALAGPQAQVLTTLGDHTVFIVDASGSMTADEDGVSRLELARRRVLELASTLSVGQEISIVEAGPRAEVLVAGATSMTEAAGALDDLDIQHGPADLADAFTLAAALQRPEQSTVTQLVTDSNPPAGVTGVLRDVVVQPVGSDRDNVAVNRLQVVPTGAGTSELFVAVRNFSLARVTVRLSITVDGEEVQAEVLELGPRETTDRVMSVAGTAGQVVAARIEPAGDAPPDDSLSLDDAAFALLQSREDVNVTVATPGNLFLTAALEAVSGVTVTTVASVPDDLGDADVLVVDRLPAPDEMAVPMLLIAPTTWPDGIEAGPTVARPTITTQAPHELLTAVDLSPIAIAEATPLTSTTLTPLASGVDGDLITAGRLGGSGVVAMGFVLTDSNLPLTAAWPTFVANTVGWLAGPPAAVPATAGTTVTVPVPPGVSEVTVSPPSGGSFTVSAGSAEVLVDQVGLWRLDAAAQDMVPAIAVNPDPLEGDLAQPRPAKPQVVAASASDPDPETTTGQSSVARWVVMAMLALLVVEWLRTTLPGRIRQLRDPRTARS